MSQNLVSLALSADQLTEVNKALDMLEKHLAGRAAAATPIALPEQK
ncbi:hypothetical protein [Aquabacterium sp.]|nr:hypothetical protein [Aquabacterium sp.]MDD2978078.1 hypothetical protein [Aquabacterium sp.]